MQQTTETNLLFERCIREQENDHFKCFKMTHRWKQTFPHSCLIFVLFPASGIDSVPFFPLWRREFMYFLHQLVFPSPRYPRARVIIYEPFAVISCGGAYLVRAANLGRRRCWGV